MRSLQAQLRETEAALQSARLQVDMEASEWKAKAYAEGFEQGKQAGERAGYEALEKQAKGLAQVIDSIAGLQQEVLESSEDQLVVIVMEAICKVLGESLTNESTVRSIVRQTVNRAKGASAVRIHVNPSDYRLVSSLPAEALRSGPQAVEFLPDETIEIGGCVLESEAGTLDRSLDTQLDQLKTLLLSVRNTHD